jgi:hypothetical protein
MRRYDIVFGIFLILSIIDLDFTLAAPVLVQEKRQACVDAVHIPRDVKSVLGKRGDQLDVLWDYYFKTSEKPVELSDTHAQASSSSAPPGHDHGSTNVVQAPAPNPTSSTAESNPLMESPSSSSSESSVEPASDDEWGYEGNGDFHGPQYTSSSSESSVEPAPDDEWWYEGDGDFHGSPYTSPSSGSPVEPASDDGWWYEGDGDFHGLPYAPTSLGHGLDHELTGAHAPQPNPNPMPSTDPDFDWNYYFPVSEVHPPSTSAGLPPPSPELGVQAQTRHGSVGVWSEALVAG